MRKMISLLTAVWMTIGIIPCVQAVTVLPQSATTVTLANAIVSVNGDTPFPTCGQAVLNILTAKSGDVQLINGSLKLTKGTYRVTFAAQLQNSGGADVMQVWLETRIPPFRRSVVIPNSTVQVGISAVPSSSKSVSFQVLRDVFLQLKTSRWISLNYSTQGKAILSSIPAWIIPTSQLLTPPPFYLSAVKIN